MPGNAGSPDCRVPSAFMSSKMAPVTTCCARVVVASEQDSSCGPFSSNDTCSSRLSYPDEPKHPLFVYLPSSPGLKLCTHVNWMLSPGYSVCNQLSDAGSTCVN